MPPKRRAGRPKKRAPGFAKWKKERKEAKEAADKAAEAPQEVQPIATPLDPPPSAPAQAKTGSITSFFRSVEENLVAPSPQLGSASTDTASRAPGDADPPRLQMSERGAKQLAKELKVCKERLAEAQAQLGANTKWFGFSSSLSCRRRWGCGRYLARAFARRDLRAFMAAFAAAVRSR